MSDKYGRKPLLIMSIFGTAVSFFMMAFAPTAIFLFIARALDGITAGNIPVVSAVISDTTSLKDRAKGFGIIGASFGFGFVLGPAISALTVALNPAFPFIIAGVLSLVATLATILFLPETNQHIGDVKSGKLFDFTKLYHALFQPNIGVTLLITFFYFLGLHIFIYAFQPYSVKILDLAANRVAMLFMLFGVLGLVTQLFIVARVSKWFGIKKSLSGVLFIVICAFVVMFVTHSYLMFVISIIILGIPNAMVQPFINTILSQETDAKSQGTIMGLNASYMSLGMIFGPILGGALATISLSYPFLGGAFFTFICFVLSFKVLKPGVSRESAF